MSLNRKWQLVMKIEAPSGVTSTIPCQVDDVTSLIYVSVESKEVGVHRCQIVFNAYPVQSRRCHIRVRKGNSGSTLVGRKTYV